jgi:hypothetical protein
VLSSAPWSDSDCTSFATVASRTCTDRMRLRNVSSIVATSESVSALRERVWPNLSDVSASSKSGVRGNCASANVPSSSFG